MRDDTQRAVGPKRTNLGACAPTPLPDSRPRPPTTEEVAHTTEPAWTEERIRAWLEQYRTIKGHVTSPPACHDPRYTREGGELVFVIPEDADPDQEPEAHVVRHIPWEQLMAEKIDIERALECLTSKQRGVIACLYTHTSWTQQEVADAMGVSQPVVCEHRDAAIRRMAHFLGE